MFTVTADTPNLAQVHERQHREAERVGDRVEDERSPKAERGDADAGCDRSEHDRELVGERHQRVGACEVRVVDETRWHRLQRRMRERRRHPVECAQQRERAEVVRAKQRERRRDADRLCQRERRLRAQPVDDRAGERSEHDAGDRERDAEQRDVARIRVVLVRRVSPDRDDRGP